jgi:membrane protein YqaA with SNARE-associated domain
MLESLQHWLVAQGPYLAAFIYCFFGGLVPMLNTELFMLFLGSYTHYSFNQNLLIIVVASLGRMLGKTLLYYSFKKGADLKLSKKQSKFDALLKKWHQKVENLPHWQVYLLTLTASSTGLPPMYVLTIVLGVLHIHWKVHFLVGFVGTMIKYAFFLGLGNELIHFFKELV